MRKAIVIDLDGTLLRTNTFRDYLKFCCGEAFSAMRWGVGCQVCLWALLRLLRLISHARMKYQVLLVTQSLMTEEKITHFVDQEMQYLDTSVKEMFAEYTMQGYFSLLATAAPACYAAPLARRLAFDGCCATLNPLDKFSAWQENKGEVKRENVLAILQTNDLQLAVVVTDHEEDRPLMDANREGKNILWKSY